MVGDWKIDRAGSSRRAITIDICRLGIPILCHTFGVSLKRKARCRGARTTQRRLPKVYSLGYRPLWAMAPLQEFSLIELESSSNFTHQMTADAATLAKTN
jgi:hypothetical protein